VCVWVRARLPFRQRTKKSIAHLDGDRQYQTACVAVGCNDGYGFVVMKGRQRASTVMLHLLPVRLVLKVLLTVSMFAVLCALSLNLSGEQSLHAKATLILTWVSYTDFLIGILLAFGWRYIPGFTRFVYPDVAGRWTGLLRYKVGDVVGSKPATLWVRQGMLGIRLLLETDESESETLVVQPMRDADFRRFKLFYIFENRRKEGQDVAESSYRGTAVIRLEGGRPNELSGDYFTARSEGTIHFTRAGGL
jgi:SMODS-associating 2TM, beta-strand rich effector domain